MVREVMENYLECILMLNAERGCARSVDVAERLGLTKPTVSHMLKQFRENGLIVIDGAGAISLTDSGRAVAEPIYDRHVTIARLLMHIGVEEKTAYIDACRIEHDLSDETFDCLCRYTAHELE
jgi:Mn-dependent transcriptional regulator